ncbi:hypothetical protein AMTR_s00067p00165630 [Amborella trichopoda]|uniref:Uncharacterized protein n=1 Tax=Amborella trichopoda TaxID=13333 RepID=U5CZV9_AMBTC|nr:hypothetical protein AMTR_s00067p00165630 [Amborella trichopoda]
MSSSNSTSKKRKITLDFDAQASNDSKQDQAESEPANRILAYYLAHEFLSHGSLFGLTWSRAAGSSLADLDEPRYSTRSSPRSREIYADVASIVKSEDVHLPGIVNPIQLSHWLEL